MCEANFQNKLIDMISSESIKEEEVEGEVNEKDPAKVLGWGSGIIRRASVKKICEHLKDDVYF